MIYKHDIASSGSAALDLTRVADAVRILTTNEHAVRRFDVPDGCAQRGDVVFGMSDVVVGGQTRLVDLARQHGCDLISLMLSGGALGISLAVIGNGVTDWHHQFRLWRSPEDAQACFIPVDACEQPWFRIDRGCLVEGGAEPPYLDRHHRDLGVRLADAAVRRLARVR